MRWVSRGALLGRSFHTAGRTRMRTSVATALRVSKGAMMSSAGTSTKYNPGMAVSKDGNYAIRDTEDTHSRERLKYQGVRQALAAATRSTAFEMG